MQKEITSRDPKYLAYIRTHYCTTCGHPPGPHEIQAAHVRMKANAGMGQKPSDYRTVPLCVRCHQKEQHFGEKAFWGMANVDPFQEIIKLNGEFIAILRN